MLTYSANTHLLETHSLLGTAPGTGDILGTKDVDMASCSWNDGVVGPADVSQGIIPLGLKEHLGLVPQGKLHGVVRFTRLPWGSDS